MNHGVGSVIWFLKEIVWDDFHSAEGRGALHRGTVQSQAEALPAPSTQKHACPLAPQSEAAQEPTTSLPVLTGCRGASFPLFSPKSVEPTARPRAFLTTLALASQETERRVSPRCSFALIPAPMSRCFTCFSLAPPVTSMGFW